MKNNKGSLSIEAALVIPILVFFMLTITNFVKMIMVYDSIQTSINNTAKQISSQSFYLSTTGLSDVVTKLTNDDSNEAAKSTVGLIKEITNMFNDANSSLPDMSDYLSTPTGDYFQFFKELRGDAPKYAAYSLFAIFDLFIGDKVEGGINNFVVGLAKNNLILDIAGNSDSETKLKNWGIVGGEDGFDFGATKCKIGDESFIEIIVSYKYDPGNSILKVDPVEITQRVYLVPWIGIKRDEG